MGLEVGAALVGMHLGALHPIEKVLTFALAFGPFLLLGAVIAWRRRAESAEDSEDAELGGDAESVSPVPPGRLN